MKTLILGLALAAVAVPITPVLADPPAWAQANGRRDDDGRRYDNRNDNRGHDDHHDNNWRDRNNNNNRQGAYYAERDYRPGGRERRLNANDRVYRGGDGRYYCKRNDGSTGLIIGALGGGVLGNVLTSGGSQTLGTLLGAGAGGLLGRSIDRNNVRCR